MPRVIITPNAAYNSTGIRLLLAELNVTGPMFQDETTIRCVMDEQQIRRFREGRGSAHHLVELPDTPKEAILAAFNSEQYQSNRLDPIIDPDHLEELVVGNSPAEEEFPGEFENLRTFAKEEDILPPVA